MDKVGQFQPFFLLMVGITIFLISFTLVSSLINTSNLVRSSMDCSNSSISRSEKINCAVTDMVSPFIFAVILGAGATAITAKLLGG